MVFLKALEQHVLGVFVRNVADHDGGPSVVFDPADIDHVGSGLFEGHSSFVSHGWSLEVVIKSVRHLHHHWHVACRVTSVHPARHLSSFCLWSCITSRDWIGAVFCVFCDNPHAWVDNGADHLILLLTFRWFPAFFGLMVGVNPRLFLILILKEKDGVVKSLLAVRRHLPLIFAWHAKLREVALLLLLLSWLDLGLDQLGVVFGVGGGCVLVLFLRGGGHEAIEMRVLKGNQLLLTLSRLSLLRLVAAKRGGASLLHAINQYNQGPPSALKCNPPLAIHNHCINRGLSCQSTGALSLDACPTPQPYTSSPFPMFITRVRRSPFTNLQRRWCCSELGRILRRRRVFWPTLWILCSLCTCTRMRTCRLGQAWIAKIGTLWMNYGISS